MKLRFNPFLKIGLDIVSTPGTTPLVPFDQVAADYTALPDPTVNDGQYWLTVGTIKTGTWPTRVTRSKGIWYATAGAWEYKGADVPAYLTDDALLFKDDGTGFGLGFELSTLSSNRRATWPDKNGTVAFTSDSIQSRVIVNQSNYTSTLGGVIDSSKEYFLDGIIDMGTTQITVPTTGLTLRGYSFDISGLVSSEDNYTMFISESIVIGSGNLLGSEYHISVTGTSSKVYELYDATGNNAFEFTRVNYNNCSSLGDIYDYRQGLESGTGRFGGSPSLTLHGLWNGGYRVSTSIVRGMSDTTTEPLFKAGSLFQMTSRFLTDINADLGTLQPLLDFAPVNFPNPSTLELVDCLVTRDGVVNPQDTNLTPNIEASSLSSSWVGNNGVVNTFVGGESVITTEVTTVIATRGVPVPALGTQTTIDLQHFDAPSNGQLRFLGTKPVEYTISWDFVLDGQQNAEYRIDLCRVRQGVKSIVHSQIRVINNLQGGRDVAYYTGSHHERLFQTDYTFFEVANLTGSQNCTLELDSSWLIDAR